MLKKREYVILISPKCDDELFADAKFRDRLRNNSASIITYVRAIEETYTWKQCTSRPCGITECTLQTESNQPTHMRMHPRTAPFIMRKHSARTSENLGLLINITVAHYGTYVVAAHIRISQQHPPVHLRTRLVTSEQHDRLRLHRNPLSSRLLPQTRYTLRRNARVITINLYDRFTSHRVLSVIWHARLGGNFSASRRARFVSTRMILSLARKRIRVIVSNRQIRLACGIIGYGRRSSIEHETASKTTTRVCKWDAWFCYESTRSLN